LPSAIEHAAIDDLMAHIAALEEDLRFVEFRFRQLKDQLIIAELADRPEVRGAIRQALERFKL
jgi:hypothetical protein